MGKKENVLAQEEMQIVMAGAIWASGMDGITEDDLEKVAEKVSEMVFDAGLVLLILKGEAAVTWKDGELLIKKTDDETQRMILESGKRKKS
jgi:hypothetical protein